jgi:hypothetical protein
MKYMQITTQNLEFKDQACVFEDHMEEFLNSESANIATA